MNATMNYLVFTNSVTCGWVVTALIFATILFLICLLSQNFRQFIYGSIFIVLSFVIYKVSRAIGVSTAIDKDYVPIKWFGYVAGFIIISIFIGWILKKFGFVKDIEDKFDDDGIRRY